MDPEAVLGLTLGLTAILGVLALGGGVVYLILRARTAGGFRVPWRALLRLYIYLVLVAGLMVTVKGLADLAQAGLGAALGKEFSYFPVYAPAAVPPPAPTTAEGSPAPAPTPVPVDEEEGLDLALREGLLRGISFSLVGLLVWGSHLWARRRLEAPGEEEDLLGRAYLVLLLAIFSLMALVSLPTALYDALRFYLLDARGVRPGGPLATALVVLPFWAWYLRRAVHTLRRESPPPEA